MIKFLNVLIFLMCMPCAFAKLIITGKGNKVESLRQAVVIALAGDSILLQKGIYREGTIMITKPITLIGQNNPILDGENKHELLLLSGKNITIKDITFINSGYSAMNDFAAIKIVDSDNIRIENNNILKAYFAIHTSNSTNVNILNNKIIGSPKSEQLTGNGIHFWKSGQATVSGNYISGHRDGIYLEFVNRSVIKNNHSEQNIRYGLHFMFSNDNVYLSNMFKNNGAGVAVMYSKRVQMKNNTFYKNWGASSYGLLLKDITDSKIEGNKFIQNTMGIYMESSSRMLVSGNTFSENGWAMKIQADCDDNLFSLNNLYANSFDVGTNGTMVLNKFENNYWDKYEGYDINKDGTGDVPYHPVSMYSIITEQNPATLILLKSFLINLLDRAERAIPSLTPENLVDHTPRMNANKL